MNLALYREFRPKNFDEIIGQDFIVKTLKNQIKTNRLTHAYLFCGPRGTGKTSTAKIFAKAVNCTHSVDGNPCEMCAECVALSEPNTDIIEIDAASNNRVEEIRDLREKVTFPPLIGKYKVYIVDEVHMLTDSAFNALLKTLEEPPKHAIFILATTEIHKLPATILSRCTRFDFKLLPLQTLVEHLKNVFDKKNIKYDEKSLYLIAKAGEGSVRDMLSIADSVASFCDYNINYKDAESVIGLSNQDAIKNILLSIANQDLKSLFVAIKSTIESGKNIQVLCKELSDFIKNVIHEKTDVIASGYSCSFSILACNNESNLFGKLFLVNPPSFATLSKIPGKRSKLYKFLLEVPVFGTLVYNMITCQSNVELLFTENYLFNPFKVTPEMIDVYYEAAHKGFSSSKYLMSSMVGRYMNNSISHALRNINQSIVLIFGEHEDSFEEVGESYTNSNPAIETTVIASSKHLPHMEAPEKFVDTLKVYE